MISTPFVLAVQNKRFAALSGRSIQPNYSPFLSALLERALSAAAASITYTVAAPTFSPDNGEHEGSVEVTMATTTTGASIYYTLDGSDPLLAGTLYSAPITITETSTLKAVATKSGMLTSPLASTSYLITPEP